MTPLPKGFPRMLAQPDHADALAWYDMNTHGPALAQMKFQARDENVNLIFPHPTLEGFLGVPRTLAPWPSDPARDYRSVGAFEFEAEFKSELRPEQIPFVSEVFQTLEDELGCIGQAPTGFGKTTTGCNLIAKIGRPACVVVPKGDLAWDTEILRHTDIPESKISYWSGGTLPDPEAWVVIASLQSVYRLNHYPAEVYARFSTLIVDEVHRIASEEFSALMRQFPAMWRLGLSATPERRDGKMPLINSHMGWKHVRGYSDAIQPDYYIIPSTWAEPFDKAGKQQAYNPARTDQTKRSMMADPLRNAAIAGAALRAHKAGRRTIIFVEQIKHGERIKAALRSMKVPAYAIVDYSGDIKKEDRARAEACPPGIILIATYKYTAEGTNIPMLDCAIFAHPIYDPRQAAGRITRKPPKGMTKPKPVVLFVWDVNSPTLKRIATAGWDYMRKLGAVWKGEFK